MVKNNRLQSLLWSSENLIPFLPVAYDFAGSPALPFRSQLGSPLEIACNPSGDAIRLLQWARVTVPLMSVVVVVGGREGG